MHMHKEYSLQYEFIYNGVLVRPGALLKMKGIYEKVTYECIIHDLGQSIDYLLVWVGKEKRLLPFNRMKTVVPSKRSRNNK